MTDTNKTYAVRWQHIAQDIITVRAGDSTEALRLAISGLGDVTSSEPVKSLAYVVYNSNDEPLLTADGSGTVLGHAVN